MTLKRSSSTIVIGARTVEAGPNTFTQSSVDLQLNPLDNEVFVVQAINLDAQAPDAIAATDTAVSFAMTTMFHVPGLSPASVVYEALYVIPVSYTKVMLNADPFVLVTCAITVSTA